MQKPVTMLAAALALIAAPALASSPEEEAALTLFKAGQYEQAAAAFGKIAADYSAK